MSYKVFVRNVPKNATEEIIKDAFTEFGEVIDVTIPCDKYTLKPRGFVYVLFRTKMSMEAALAKKSCKVMGAVVDICTAKASAHKEPESPRLFIRGIPTNIKEEDLLKFFNSVGEVVLHIFPRDRNNGLLRNFCFITYKSVELTQKLLNDGYMMYNDTKLSVEPAKPRNELYPEAYTRPNENDRIVEVVSGKDYNPLSAPEAESAYPLPGSYDSYIPSSYVDPNVAYAGYPYPSGDYNSYYPDGSSAMYPPSMDPNAMYPEMTNTGYYGQAADPNAMYPSQSTVSSYAQTPGDPYASAANDPYASAANDPYGQVPSDPNASHVPQNTTMPGLAANNSDPSYSSPSSNISAIPISADASNPANPAGANPTNPTNPTNPAGANPANLNTSATTNSINPPTPANPSISAIPASPANPANLTNLPDLTNPSSSPYAPNPLNPSNPNPSYSSNLSNPPNPSSAGYPPPSDPNATYPNPQNPSYTPSADANSSYPLPASNVPPYTSPNDPALQSMGPPPSSSYPPLNLSTYPYPPSPYQQYPPPANYSMPTGGYGGPMEKQDGYSVDGTGSSKVPPPPSYSNSIPSPYQGVPYSPPSNYYTNPPYNNYPPNTGYPAEGPYYSTNSYGGSAYEQPRESGWNQRPRNEKSKWDSREYYRSNWDSKRSPSSERRGARHSNWDSREDRYRVSHQGRSRSRSRSRSHSRSRSRSADYPLEDKDRIFISGLDPHVTEAIIREHFSPYGRVKHVKLPIDHKTGRQRDIAMVTMDSAESVNRALREASRTIMGREVKQMCRAQTKT